ncbi:Eco57I restriction-modification methylase domain-containing protein [Flavobacterium reichenbachii]|uniref:site-specific DNA-methyltransferase (adenine-specific) n=1 Tax=Flavobacterium reichenbachii TaxID=362418 RepID=A0A085ZFR3_9FLAO|nr:DNA methyltransferase [Flavobacterium reichenbachii]KFF03277.1 hypothetical protein IW19_20480 [Flavobacterium reichenbachii]OXB15257.1 hypothetical protein B0A68_11085 [Flavobacterium reichenbachii]
MIKNNKALKDLLSQLQLLDSESVFFYNQKNDAFLKHISKETFKKLDIIQPDAFYVFNDQPYILFFDFCDNYSLEREKEIHRQVWSFDQAPLIFIIKHGDIGIYNAFSYNKQLESLQRIDISEEIRNEQFSFWNLQSGSAWKWLQENYYKTKRLKDGIQNKRVNQKLFENIKLVREELANEDGLTEDDANILILRLIFIRYLIDRNVKLNEDYIPEDEILEKRKTFSQLIENPVRLNSFFLLLNNKFNGVLFKNTDIILSEKQSKALGHIFRGEKPEEGSLFYAVEFYFEVFDFSIIPVEVISGIYESLIDPETRKLHSAVYTPSFLVEYILSNSVDVFLSSERDGKVSECKIFDPSVGSGIFLVQSFRRIVDKEIAEKGKVTKERLKEIAENNLFGIDINPQALKVTSFSIYIAILDYLEPKSITSDDFQDLLPKLLDRNLFEANFFDTSNSFNDIILKAKPDFILGNPPWKSEKEETHLKWLKDNNKVIGRFEIAQSFLLRSKDFMSENTVSALIVTSTIFYNISKTTKKFKTDFLTQFCVECFFDLSPVRRLIFEEKDSPCCIVYYKLSDGESHKKNLVRHLSVKSNIFLKYYKTLVIEKFDQKSILQKHFIENDWMFKVALFGSTLDFLLFKKLLKTGKQLESIIDNKTILLKGSGIKENPKVGEFPFLIGKKCLENKEVSQYFTPRSSGKELTADDVHLQSGRREILFLGDQILLKAQAEGESDIVASYTQTPFVFKHDVFGIATQKDPDTLLFIYTLLISKLQTYYQYLTNCSWGIATRPAIRLEEYLSFPYEVPDYHQKAVLLELADRFLKPYRTHYEQFNIGSPVRDEAVFSEINSAVNQLYNITGSDIDLIDYVLDVSRYQFQESKQNKFIRKINNDKHHLSQYAKIFLMEFQKIYNDDFLQIQIFSLNHFVAMHFIFLDHLPQEQICFIEDSDDSQESQVFRRISQSISISQVAKDLYIQKDIKGFEENSFYIIKPNEFKCWHRAMAWYDVAEFKEAIQSAELDRLNEL